MMGRLAYMEQSEPGKGPENIRLFPSDQASRYLSPSVSNPLQSPTDFLLPHLVGSQPGTRPIETHRCASSFAEIPSLEPRSSSFRDSSFSPSSLTEVKQVRSSAVSPNLKLPPILSVKSASAPDTISMAPQSIHPPPPSFGIPCLEDGDKASLMDMKMAYENMMVSYFMPQSVKSENTPLPDKQQPEEMPQQNQACLPSSYSNEYVCHPLSSMHQLVQNCSCEEEYDVFQSIISGKIYGKNSQSNIPTSKVVSHNRKHASSNSQNNHSVPMPSSMSQHTAMDVTSSGCTLLQQNMGGYHPSAVNLGNNLQTLKPENGFNSCSISATVPQISSDALPNSEAQASMMADEDHTSNTTDMSAVLNELSMLMPNQESAMLEDVYATNIRTPFTSAATATCMSSRTTIRNSVSNVQYQNRSDPTWGRFSVLPPVMSSATPSGGGHNDGDNISVMSCNTLPNNSNAQNNSQMGMYYTSFSPFSVNFSDNLSSALASSPRYSGRSSYSGKGSRNKRALSNSPLSAEGIDLNSIIRMSPTSLIAYINGSRSSSSCVSPGSAGDRTGCYGHLSARNSSSSPNSGSNSSGNRRSISFTPQTATPGMSNSRSNPSNVTSDNSNVSVSCANEVVKNDYLDIDENLLVIQAMQDLEAGAALSGNASFPFCGSMHPVQIIPECENLQVMPQDIAAYRTEDFLPFIPAVLPPVHTHLQSHYQPTSQTGHVLRQQHHKPPPTYDQHMARKATLQKNSSSESSQPSNSSSFESSEGDKTLAGSSTDTETNRMYACMWLDCAAVFQDQDEFVTHIEKAHIDQKKGDEFVCYWKLCPRRLHPFNARYKLLVHMRVHSGDKPNKCTYAGCKKAFSRLENLKIHLRSHTGERPYSCTYPGCTKTFSNSSDRTKHQKTHHDTKPYVCQVTGCGKRYTDPSSLRKHVKKSHPDKKEPDRKKIRGGAEEMDPKDLNECLMIQAIKPITLCDASPPEPTDSGLGRSPRSSQPGSSSDHYPAIGRTETAQGSSCHTSPSSHHSSPPSHIERDKLPPNNNSLRVPVLPPITPTPVQKQSPCPPNLSHGSKLPPASTTPSVRIRASHSLIESDDVRSASNNLQDRRMTQDVVNQVTGIYSSCSNRSGYKSTDMPISSLLKPHSRYEKEGS